MLESHHQSDQPRPGHPPGMQSRPGNGPQRSVHLFDRVAVVIKYYKVVVVVFALVVAGMMYQTYTTIPMYVAQARILIDEEHTAQADFNEQVVYSDPEIYNQTQYKILQGRDLARRAIERLDLSTVPEFNGTGPTPTKLSQIVDSISSSVTGLFGSDDPATPPPAREVAAATETGADDAVAGDATADDAISDADNGLIGAFQARISVVPVRSSRLVDVTFTSADPVFAAKAINVLAEEYVNQNIEYRLQNTDQTLEWLQQEVARQAATVQAS